MERLLRLVVLRRITPANGEAVALPYGPPAVGKGRELHRSPIHNFYRDELGRMVVVSAKHFPGREAPFSTGRNTQAFREETTSRPLVAWGLILTKEGLPRVPGPFA